MVAQTPADGDVLSLILRPRLWAFGERFGINYGLDTRRMCVKEQPRGEALSLECFIEKDQSDWGATVMLLRNRAGGAFRREMTGRVTYVDLEGGRVCVEEVYNDDAQGSFRFVDEVKQKVVDAVADDDALLVDLKRAWAAMIAEEHDVDDADDAMREEIAAFFDSGDGGNYSSDPAAPRRLWMRGTGRMRGIRGNSDVEVGAVRTFHAAPFAYVMNDGSRAGVTFSFNN